METMSAFEDSTEFVNNGTELRRRLDENSYLFIRGLLPKNTILNIRSRLLKKAASGGELARINLSFKQILSEYLQMPTSIFDEIDTGVSGEVARKVGSVMKNMAKNQQVIVIKHLPQIASLGNHHKYVHKIEKDNLIETQVKNLVGDDRIHEIAKMISGDNLTKHAI